eukprot:Clim_evm57s243 gene=Clim_evmTU57s243
MPLKTKLTEMLGIQHPIVCGGMTGAGTAELTAAVSNAGALGCLTALNTGSPENLRREIARVRSMTDKPFAVNLTILPAITPPPYEEFARVIIEEGIKIVETAGNNPKKWVRMFKDAGLICIHKCTSIRHAQSSERAGVDIVSMDGFECAGHPGEDDNTLFTLLPICKRKLKVPFIASGSIGDGAGLAAALSMGAIGINMGTRFCVTKECPWPQEFKQRCVESDERQTTLIFRSLRNTARVYKNKVAEEVVNIESQAGQTDFADLAPLVNGTRGREGEKRGDPDHGIWTAGPVIGLIDDIPTCHDLVAKIVRDAEGIIRENASLVTFSSAM